MRRFTVLAGLVLAGLLLCACSEAEQLYQSGEDALRAGDLSTAERVFREVLKQDPNMVGARVNLAVVYMRRKQWTEALDQLERAEKRSPQVAGIRLNIGIAHYRRGDYRDAIAPFESVLRDQPDSTQARYLLGVCYFLVERYADSLTTLQPLGDQQAANLQYLYVTGIAAGKAGHPEIERPALEKLAALGQNSPEMHLLLGKAHLAREEWDEAAAEFQKANLPFAHYYLGVILRNKQDLDGARTEFLADLSLQPDSAFDYEALGDISAAREENAKAEEYYRKALHLEPRLATSHYSLAKLLKHESRFRDALTEADAASALDAHSSSLHYLRAQLLQKLNRPAEAQREFDTSATMRQKVRDDLEQKISGRALVPEP